MIKPDTTETTEAKIRSLAPSIDPRTLDVLVEMYDAHYLLGTEDGSPVQIDRGTRISLAQGAAIRQLMVEHSVSKSLEVGFAYGFSTIWMLDALRANKGSHTTVDPFEKTAWHGIGLKQVEKLQFDGTFQWMPDHSIHVLSALIRAGQAFDFVFIDGNHRFDDVIVDFYMCDQLVRVGGLIALDDMWMPSIKAATDFIVKNRDYRIKHCSIRNMLVLEKLGDDKRTWRHFQPFDAPPKRKWRDRLASLVRRIKLKP